MQRTGEHKGERGDLIVYVLMRRLIMKRSERAQHKDDAAAPYVSDDNL